MAAPDDIDDDTVLSALLPIDRTVVSAGAMPVDEQTIVSGPGGELDEKTHAVQRRALNSGDSDPGARVAFAPAARRERYSVRSGGTELPAVARMDISAPTARQPVPTRKPRNGALVLLVVVGTTAAVAGAVFLVLTMVFRQ